MKIYFGLGKDPKEENIRLKKSILNLIRKVELHNNQLQEDIEKIVAICNKGK